MNLFVQVTEAINYIYENAAYDASHASDPVQLEEEHLDMLARVLLESEDIRKILAQTVSGLLQEAKRGMETESSGNIGRVRKSR